MTDLTATLTIRHTPADGTLLEGTRKGDGAWEAIKAAQAAYRIRGWRYMPSIRAIGVSHSRDRAPLLGLIERTADVLREAGFVVEVEVETAPRAMEDAEADRAERMDDRADALRAKVDRKTAEADARWAAAQEIAEHIPPGQPILRGHYSERGHRRALQRMDTHTRKSLEAEDEARRAEDGAASAERHMARREAPGVTARRIETLEAERRKVQRALDGYIRNHRRHDGSIYYQDVTPAATGLHREQLDARAAHLDEQLRYWRQLLDEHRAAGRWVDATPDVYRVGDLIRCGRGAWREIIRVNRKTVTINPGWEGGRQTVPLGSITDHRRPDPAPADEAQDLDTPAGAR